MTHARQSAQAVAAADASLQWLTHESDDALVVRALADGDVLHGMACGNEGGVGLRLDVTSLERAASRAAVRETLGFDGLYLEMMLWGWLAGWLLTIP